MKPCCPDAGAWGTAAWTDTLAPQIAARPIAQASLTTRNRHRRSCPRRVTPAPATLYLTEYTELRPAPRPLEKPGAQRNYTECPVARTAYLPVSYRSGVTA